MSRDAAIIRQIIRNHLKEALESDLESRAATPFGQPVFAGGQFDPDVDPVDLDIEILDDLIGDAREALSRRDFHMVRSTVDALLAEHDLPKAQGSMLALGLLEANLKFLEEARKRTLGGSSLFPLDEEIAGHGQPLEPRRSQIVEPPAKRPSAARPEAPRFSELVEPFTAWRALSGVRGHTLAQDKPTLRFFVELAGDKSVNDYSRSDVTRFLLSIQRFPATYGRSPVDRELSAEQLIARADDTGCERVSAKTAKRHLSVLSRFFKFCLDESYVTKAERDELVEDHEFSGSGTSAREERDTWEPEELRKLFASPVWTGCHPYFRAKAGPSIIRDANFWLPLLALFHGCRVEEFADLYRRDIQRKGTIWFVHLDDTERGLKNQNAKRAVPLHAEILRMGFLDYVQRMAPKEGDPLFPDLVPQGPDRKRGPRITRWFVHYRRAIGVYREGVAMHAFRHTANTRLRDVISDYQQERRVSYLLGHSKGGGEGRERYDKGPGLAALSETLNMLTYPELDFSHLWVPVREEAEGAKKAGCLSA